MRIQNTIVDMLKSLEDDQIYIIEVNYLLGAFTEAYIKYSGKLKNQKVFSSVKYDNKKLDALANFLLNEN